MQSDTGSGDLYSVDHDAIERVFDSIPPAFRRKPRLLRQNIRRALADIFKRGHTTQWLETRLTKYLSSQEARSPHFREIATWLDDEGYDEDPSVWNKRENRAQKPVTNEGSTGWLAKWKREVLKDDGKEADTHDPESPKTG